MKTIFRLALAVSFLFFTQTKIFAQTSGMEALLTEGYDIDEMENIAKNITYKNYMKWMKKNNYTYQEEMNDGYTQVFKKNDIVTVGLFFSPDDKEFKFAMFFSSPQKFYMAKREIEDAGFKKAKVTKIKNDNGVNIDVINWEKAGYPYTFESNPDDSYIKIIK